ncbi:MAG: lytic transglycosylase domain-containing protein [Kiritimatiellae bacterium]|nr:lytic transglycosylase domain-containing protein [Kiritimatiellia bacterium]
MWHKQLNSNQEPPRHPLPAIGCGILVGIWVLWFILSPLWTHTPERTADETTVQLPTYDHDAINLVDATDLLIDAIIQIESRGDPTRVGSVGERGLMQIRESTWKEVTERHFDAPVPFSRAFEPDLNREVGRLYLGRLQQYLYDYKDHWRSDLRSLLLASYNAGPEKVRASGFDLRKLPLSVQSYAERGSALHDAYLQDDVHTLHQLLIEAAELPEPAHP